MFIIRRFGFRTARFIASFNLFFQYCGHFLLSTLKIISRKQVFSFNHMVKTLHFSGARLVIPLMLICLLSGTSISLNVHSFLGKFNLQEKALIVMLNILTRDFLPLMLVIILCIQSSLDLINAKIKRLYHSHHDIMATHILPITVGMNLSALLLFTYTTVTIMFSIYFIHNYIYRSNMHEFLLILSSSVTLQDLLISLFKTITYCIIASIIVGYYYYLLAARFIPLRRAVSRIISRGLIWVALTSVCFKLLNM